jgi:3-hydroxy-9,10-secoandrosta-1,3,5(10)-triene-9,17-dione monooxygenase reductase component
VRPESHTARSGAARGPGGARTAAVTDADLRRAASAFPTGVALVTGPGGLGLHVDTFISVSLDPPLVAFSPSRQSLTWRRIRRDGRIGISVLGAQHAAGLHDRARPGADSLAGLEVELAGAVPVVRDALAVLLCVLEAEHPAGDHTLVVARVLEVRDGAGGAPLVFHRGAFGTVARFAQALPAVYPRPVH